MGARVSAETKQAISLWKEGELSVYRAAQAVGIYPKTLYRAISRDKSLKRLLEKRSKKVLAVVA